ncbi:MAG: hypothetical protein H8D96_21610 [Desulfobacterales bacterium]|uniref:Uncharacterized protein n=1 Tax=Candidatus Desulfatibia vada TaxID=2841696 RepID=A0A8J6P3L5_9BACT|nr:hypothetical protein [Candidatus Desulfatibia vada]
MEQLFSVLIGALIASILAVVFLHVSEKFKIRSEVLLEVVGFGDEICHHLQNLHVYKNAEHTDRDLDLTIEDYRYLSRELTVLLTSTKVHEKMAIAFGEKEELGLFLELGTQVREVASILRRTTRSAGINEGQQVNQLFKDKIDPLRHKLIRHLMKGATVTGILLDVYKCQMPTFYKITSNFIKPKT